MKKLFAEDIFGNCCKDFLAGDKDAKIVVNSDIAETDYLFAEYLFREFDEMPEHEQKAIASKRRYLDIGACRFTLLVYAKYGL